MKAFIRKNLYWFIERGYWFIESPRGAIKHYKSSKKARNYIKHRNRTNYVLCRSDPFKGSCMFKRWIFINGKFKRVKNEN